MKTKKEKKGQEVKDKNMVKDEKKRKKGKEEENDEKTEQLTKEIAHLESMYGKALATAAHHENQAKYYKNEFNRLYKYRSQDLVERLLPVLDSFHFAFKSPVSSPEVEAYKTGFEYIYIMLKKALEEEGATEIVPNIGDKFDPTIHNAVETEVVEEEDKIGLITNILLNGYMLNDRVIRPANVVVAIKKEEESKDEVEEDLINEETSTESSINSVNYEDINLNGKSNLDVDVDKEENLNG